MEEEIDKILNNEEVEEPLLKSNTIDESSNVDINNVKELRFTINTGTNTLTEYTTDKLIGKLDSIIISSDKFITLKIMLDEFKDIVIYHKMQIIGDKYISVRNDTSFPNNERAQSSDAKFILNDKLHIIIESSLDTSIKLILRYE
jgi:hypothetical protein